MLLVRRRGSVVRIRGLYFCNVLYLMTAALIFVDVLMLRDLADRKISENINPNGYAIVFILVSAVALIAFAAWSMKNASRFLRPVYIVSRSRLWVRGGKRWGYRKGEVIISVPFSPQLRAFRFIPVSVDGLPVNEKSVTIFDTSIWLFAMRHIWILGEFGWFDSRR